MNVFRRSARRDAEPKIFRTPPAAGLNRRRAGSVSNAPTPAADLAEPSGKRRRTVRAVGRLVIALAATFLVLWGCVAAYRKATTADYFAVAEIRITGNSRLTEVDVIGAASIERGVNIFRVDVEAIAQRLKQHPWVLEAKAVRKLPRGLEIGIVERKVEALVLFDVPYLVDDAGTVFKRWAPGDPTPAPIISGLSREQLAAGELACCGGNVRAANLALAYRGLRASHVACRPPVKLERVMAAGHGCVVELVCLGYLLARGFRVA